jgi:predicted RNA binding protein YcfA (HicA-like mRNA interferase family)
MGRMAQIVAERMIRALRRLGWALVRQAGSHAVLTKGGHHPITIPMHPGKTLKEGTARAILKQTGVTEEEFFDAY